MNKKVVRRCIFILIIAIIAEHSESKFRFGLRRVICTTSDIYVYNNITCKYKTYSFNSYVTFRATIKKKVPRDIKLAFTLSRRSTDGYQRVMHLDNIPVCEYLRDLNSSSTSFLKDSFDYYKNKFAMAGNWFESCDRIGEVFFDNGTLAGQGMMNVYPQGYYMSNYLFTTSSDPQVFNYTMIYFLSKVKE